MPCDTKLITRRRFLYYGIAGLAGLSIVRATNALSEEQLPKLNETDPAALSLGYVQDATQADTTAFPKRKGEEGGRQFCRSCQFYLGNHGSTWGACVVFSDNLVNSGGWCNSWVEKMGA